MHFTSLAIKTINENPTSLCALELTVVRDGRCTLQKNWFFCPLDLHFEPTKQLLYGIKPIDIIDQPNFISQWEDIRPYLENQVVICHSATYVWSTLCHLLDCYHLPYPNCYFACTMMLGKHLYPGLPNRKLSTLCHHLDILFDSHQVGDTSTCCALLFLQMSKQLHCTDCEDILNTLEITWGQITSSQVNWPTFKCPGRNIISPPNSPLVIPVSTKPTLSLHGKVVSLTGPLESMTRTQAVKRIHALGASYSSSVTSKTNVVITNLKVSNHYSNAKLTSKLSRALHLIDEGQPIVIINEETFLNLGPVLR